MHTPGAQVSNLCTRQLKCAHRVQGAPLILKDHVTCRGELDLEYSLVTAEVHVVLV